MSEDTARDLCREEGIPIADDPLGGEFVWLADLVPLAAEVDRLCDDLATAEKEMHRFERLNGRLAGDLADAQRARRKVLTILAQHSDRDPVGPLTADQIRDALSAGGGGPAEKVEWPDLDAPSSPDLKDAMDWGTDEPAASSGRAADTERQPG